MPAFKHKAYGIEWDTGPVDHARALAFEKAAKARGVIGDVPREGWANIIEAAVEVGYIPALDEPLNTWPPGKVEWLAKRIAFEHQQATAILPE